LFLMFSKFRNETGQTLVEFALVVPIFLALVFFIIDLGWITTNYLTFDYSYRIAATQMSITQSESGTQANNHIKTETVALSPLPKFTNANLSVSGSIITVTTEPVDYHTPNTSGGTDTHTRKWTYADIYSNLAYKIKPITPIGSAIFGGDITFTKELNKHRLLQTTEGTP
jgi:Flp pilus assembly protein TadG